MKVQTVPVDSIKPAKYNPRLDLKAGDPEYERIKRSIEKFGLVDPLVLNAHNKVLIGGHQRLKVLRDMGWTEIPVSVVTIKSPADEKALNLALNKIGGDWDEGKLAQLLSDLRDIDFDVELTGFTTGEVDKLIDSLHLNGSDKDNEAPPRPKKPITKRGERWILGDHELLCGDATSSKDVGLLMRKILADLVFTDPPYNVDYEGYTDEKLTIKNDKMSDTEFAIFLGRSFGSYRLACKDTAAIYICHPSSSQREFQTALETAGFAVRCQIIWAKNTFAWGFGRYKFQHEPIFYAYVKGKTDSWYGDKSQCTLWAADKPSANRLHPTMKPVELVANAITNSSRPGDTVLDLFGGSGSTLIAAEKMGRRAKLMELDPGYADVIVQRFEEFSGKKAKRG